MQQPQHASMDPQTLRTHLEQQPDLLIAYHATVETCTLLRAAFSHLPLLVCLPPEAKKSHLVELLDAGADDCVSVTIGKAELQARLRALLRSYDSPALLAMPSAPIQIISDDWCMHLDLVSRCVSVRGQPIHLISEPYSIIWPQRYFFDDIMRYPSGTEVFSGQKFYL